MCYGLLRTTSQEAAFLLQTLFKAGDVMTFSPDTDISENVTIEGIILDDSGVVFLQFGALENTHKSGSTIILHGIPFTTTTEAPTTEAPTTKAPTTSTTGSGDGPPTPSPTPAPAPSTVAPTTEAPTTSTTGSGDGPPTPSPTPAPAPSTVAPTTEAPTTSTTVPVTDCALASWKTTRCKDIKGPNGGARACKFVTNPKKKHKANYRKCVHRKKFVDNDP
jgi:hypothetical protein